MNDVPKSPADAAANAVEDFRPTGVRHQVLALVMAIAALSLFNRISISVAGAERMIADLSITPTQMGMVYSAYLFVYTLCMVPGGWLIDRIGPKRALMLTAFGTALCVPATALAGIANSGLTALGILFVARGLLGLISAPMFPGAARMVSFWIPYRGRAAANGLINGAAIVGVASTYFLFGMLMDLLGWPTAFVVSGLPMLVVALAWALGVTDDPGQHSATNLAEQRLIAFHFPSAEPLREPVGEDHSIVEVPAETVATPNDESGTQTVALLRNRSLLLLSVSYAAVGYFEYLFFYWMQYYFDDVLEFGKDKSRLYATIPSLAMALGMALGGYVADAAQERYGARRGRALVIIGSMFVSALMLGIGASCRDPLAVVVCFSIATAAIGSCEGPFWVTGIELGGRRGGISAGILNTGGNAGGIISPTLTPLVSKLFGWPAALGLACFICLAGGMLWFWIDPDERSTASIDTLRVGQSS